MAFNCSLDHEQERFNGNGYTVLLSNIFNCSFSRGNPRNGVHRHQCYEVCVVTEGSGIFVCGGVAYTVTPNNLFIVSPNVSHEIISNGEDGWLKLWFYTFAVTSSPYSQEEMTEQDKIIRDFLRKHEPVADAGEYLTSYADFQRDYLCKGGLFGKRAVALTMLLDCMKLLSTNNAIETAEKCSPFAQELASYISNNIQSDITIQKICSHLRISERTLYILFKRYFQTTPTRYINAEKIHASIGYLSMGFSIKTVAELMGFTELSSFSRLFKKVTGKSPRRHLADSRSAFE